MSTRFYHLPHCVLFRLCVFVVPSLDMWRRNWKRQWTRVERRGVMVACAVLCPHFAVAALFVCFQRSPLPGVLSHDL